MRVFDPRPGEPSARTRARVWMRRSVGQVARGWLAASSESRHGQDPPDLLRSRSILVVHLFGLGDVTHALPFFHELRRLAPEASIGAIVRPEPWNAFSHLGCVDHWIRAGNRREARSAARWFRRVVGGELDLGLLPFTGLASGWAMVAARPRHWAGHALDLSVTSNYRFDPTRLSRVRHPRQMALDVLRTMVEVEDRELSRIPVPSVAIARAEGIWSSAGWGRGPVVGMNPGSRVLSRRWPAARWADLAVRLYRGAGVRTVWMGAASDRAACAKASGLAAHQGVETHDMSGATDLHTWMGLVQRMDGFVSVDAGPLHLARAVGVPTVGLFGPVDAGLRAWSGTGHIDLQATGMQCRPCHREEWSPGCAEPPCLRDIDVEEVARSVLRQLALAA